MIKQGYSNRGFASMTPERRREVASKGGKKSTAGRDMAAVGKRGGASTKKKMGLDYFREIGRKGGKKSRKRPTSSR